MVGISHATVEYCNNLQADFREAPIKSQSDGRGVPWKHLREYGYTISNFPSHLDITRPGDWSKEDKVKLWETRAAFKFVKTTREEVESTNAHPVSQPVSQRSLPIIVPVAPVVASQALTVKETVKNLYLMNQTTCKPFLLRLQRDHPELVERATIGTIKNWVAQWRTSSSQVASSSS